MDRSSARHGCDRLFPAVREFEPGGGCASVGQGFRVHLPVDEPRLARAVTRWQHDVSGRRLDSSLGHAASVVLAIKPGAAPNPQGYRLTVLPEGVEVHGASAAGCFHGLQTLRQLFDFHGGRLPCCTIRDWPEFSTRGLLHDVTRGKVPTLTTLKALADRLAGWKLNQLQLYIEHAFVFRFDPQICAADDGLSAEEIRELDAYCQERFITLVPALATLGHMGRILSMPRYRHLAEMAPEMEFAAMSWPQRARGLTLDLASGEARSLIERMWTELLEAFRGPVVNICGDEPHDLGRGKNRDRFAGDGRAEAYLSYLQQLHRFSTAAGRDVQFWSDVLRMYPHVLPRVPRPATVLHWGYDLSTDFSATATFVRAGLDTFVCPGTSGWRRILNAMDLAEENISSFARAGRACGATGLLNTDWGDHGHFNAMACSWHGIALGAAAAWNADHPLAEDFDRRFGLQVLGSDDASVIQAIRAASRLAGTCETWRLLWTLPADLPADADLPSWEACRGAREATRRARQALSASPAGAKATLDVEELELACRFQELLVEKLGWLQRAHGGVDATDLSHPSPAAWGKALHEALDDYATVWRRRNKPLGLDDIARTLKACAREMAGLAT